ncbi:MAG: ABC transporter substrate-binding protein, partial [Sulfobacillus sp.]
MKPISRTVFTVATAGFIATAIAGCGANSAALPTKTPTAMTINVNGGGPFVTNFNPYSPSQRGGTGFIFEPMMIYNDLNGSLHPWLATSYQWSDSNTVLRFTLRNGVKFNNGTPFTAHDVVFSFNLLKKFPALDLNGVWSGLASVTQTGTYGVTFTFKKPDTTLFAYIAQTPIVSAAQWASVKNPVTFADPNPVATGPYEVAKSISSEYVLKANPYYWQKGKPAAKTITVPSLPSGAIADLKLSQNIFDWGGLFSPNIQRNYVDKSPSTNHYWYPEGPPVTLYPNDGVYPLNQTKFRQAMAMAINKTTIGKVGEYGYELPASQSGLILPSQKSWLASNLPQTTYNTSRAQSLLSKIGFHKNAQGLLVAPNGSTVNFTIQVPTGFIDWISDSQLIVQDLQALGITVRLTTPSYSTWQSNLSTGKFTLAINEANAGPTPWYYYNQTLSSALSASEGQNAASNYERWINPQTDRYLNAFSSTTS